MNIVWQGRRQQRDRLRRASVLCVNHVCRSLALLVVLAVPALRAQLGTCPVQPASRIPLTLDPASAQDARVTLLGDGTYEIATSGANPAITLHMKAPIQANQGCVLAFEYFSLRAAKQLRVEFGPSAGKKHTFMAEGLSHSETFSQYAANISASPDWKGTVSFLRVGFNSAPGQVVRLRNIVLRSPTTEELARASHLAQQLSDDQRLHSDLTAYLKQQYPDRLTSIYTSKSTVRIEGETKGDVDQLYLAEVPLYENLTELHRFDYLTKIDATGSRFKVELTRFRTLPEGRYDRLLSKWAIVRKVGSGFEIASHARYTDEVEPQWNYPDEEPRCKKGLGGVSASRPLEDLDQLGMCSITVNVFLSFIRNEAKPGDIAFSYNGHKYFADAKTIDGYDQVIKYAAQRHIIVSAILLIPPARKFPDPAIGTLMAHPDADPAGTYVMPNLTSSEGLQVYAAALNFLAERYSRADKPYGRIHHWIMHNEVDAGWVWTNAGQKSELTFMDLYDKSMRAMYLIARQYNPHSKVFISLTHYWTFTVDPKFYLPRQMLADLVTYSSTEGDYEWGVAYHPYPESLFKPRTWEDKKVSFSLDTPLITFKNIEVLDAWAHQPSTFYRGIKRRSIFLSEQGFNSPDYSEKSLTDQAAAMAYSWKKIERLDAIEAVQYHAWVDNRGEGGLRIGLRKFPDDPVDPMGKKPIWYLYQKLGTPEEDKACAFALPVIGIPNWSMVPYTGPIEGIASKPVATRDLFSDTWTATDALGRSLPGYAEVGPPRPGRHVAMFYFLTHDNPGMPGPLNVTTMLAKDPDTSHWAPANYYWGEPESGYYLSSDEWVIRRHAELLSDAGVDVIVFDTTNDRTYPNVYKTIARVFTEMRAAGEPTPQIAFLASSKSIDQLWSDLYSQGLYKDLWFQWKGHPLLMTGQQRGMKAAYELPPNIQAFFTVRQSWAWDSLIWYRDGHDQWPWVAHHPQVYGWHESPDRPEEVAVAVSEHPLSNIGTSFHDGQEPTTDRYDRTAYTGQGLFFQEQWNRALALDPELAFVTGWNEWTAASKRAGANVPEEMASWDFFPGAVLSRAGHPIKTGDLYFVDEYNEEFNRDLEPMKEGHIDNLYYQLVANIRRYKGVHASLPTSLPRTIDIDGPFSQWSDVTPEFRDHSGDTTHRESHGNYQAGPYADTTGRNDIVAAKINTDEHTVYFYVQTRAPLTSWHDKDWMLLYIDADLDHSTGRNGSDFVLNTRVLSTKKTTLSAISKEGTLGAPIEVPYKSVGNEMMIAVPRNLIRQASGSVKFDFHWTDNVPPAAGISESSLHGDSAPERRFNYHYEAVQ